MSRRKIWVNLGALAVVGVLAGGFWAGYQQAPDDDRANLVTEAGGEPIDDQAKGGPTPPSLSAPGAPRPEAVAGQWLTGQHTLHANDARPDAWISRVEQLSTERMRAGLAQFRDGNGGIVWEDFQRKQCSRTVRDVRTQPSPSSPGAQESQWVLVQAVAVTSCRRDSANPPFPPQVPVTATFELTRSSGKWLVNSRTEPA
ncbi:hypothetical protein DI005_29165 [Prauserella sp. PE36]|uniref:Mce-associated membrane protein n=1 Tax=Prauserella endophytica TaxID=1592324 RepID=A0ABY2SA14_9PSEU|nr:MULTISPECIES: hypothetical protein [Prauserella]RBM14751.1 hypothetical protein DI005_29165 [Prauserella sp. PE36]TKG72724.1 hypothetical protein FCN18_05680 [Prauserella endophytica]